MATDTPLWTEETVEEATRVLADALHADEPGTPYDLAVMALNSAGVRREVRAAMGALADAERRIALVYDALITGVQPLDDETTGGGVV